MKKASFTIESALLMPLILIVLISLIYLDIHVQNQNCLLSAACEQAVSGHDVGLLELFGALNLKRGKDEDTSRRVSYSADTIAVYGGWKWSIKEEGTYEIVKPVQLIRKIQAVKKLTGSNED